MVDLGLGLGTAAFVLAVAWYGVRKLEHAVDPIDRIRSLAQLHEDGLLEDDEHQRLRKRQISRLRWGD